MSKILNDKYETEYWSNNKLKEKPNRIGNTIGMRHARIEEFYTNENTDITH